MKIYFLPAVARLEGTYESYLRKLGAQMKRGEIKSWRGWVFTNPRKGTWLAVREADAGKIEIVSE